MTVALGGRTLILLPIVGKEYPMPGPMVMIAFSRPLVFIVIAVKVTLPDVWLGRMVIWFGVPLRL